MSTTTIPNGRIALSIGSLSNPVRAGLDLFGALLSIAAAAALLPWSGPGNEALRALVVLPVTQLMLFTVSGLYHGVHWQPGAKARWQRADHAMIYLKVAGTTTVIALLSNGGVLADCVIGAAWAIAAVGIAQKTWWPSVAHAFSIGAQFVQALLVLLVLAPFMQHNPGTPTQLLLAGMVFYLVGFTVFVREHPRLWPGRFCHHDFFHVMLVLGALSIYGSVAGCISRI